jgi:hypothetical protein
VTDLREAKSARYKLKASRAGRAGPSRTTAPSDDENVPIHLLPKPPSADAWQQWLEEHAEEVASWGAPNGGDAEKDWEHLSDEQRDLELAELGEMVEAGLITQDEYEEARSYLLAQPSESSS